jgi:hypothetical protein
VADEELPGRPAEGPVLVLPQPLSNAAPTRIAAAAARRASREGMTYINSMVTHSPAFRRFPDESQRLNRI